MKERFEATEMWYYRRMLRMRKIERKWGQKSPRIKNRKLKFLGYIIRKECKGSGKKNNVEGPGTVNEYVGQN